MSHSDHPLYVENEGGVDGTMKLKQKISLIVQGCCRLQQVLPLPPSTGFPHPVRLTEESEPTFDPKGHLNLVKPPYVVTFPNLDKVPQAQPVTSNKGSNFAWSGPFQLLSEEGLRVVRNIVNREEHR